MQVDLYNGCKTMVVVVGCLFYCLRQTCTLLTTDCVNVASCMAV